MLKSKMRWHLQDVSEDEVKQLSDSYGLHPLLARLLILRGINSEQAIDRFLNADRSEFYDPFLLDGMQEAVKRIQSAILKNEKILIYGDYDADGVTSTSLLYKTLKKLNADFAYYIPNRFSEGYGLNEDAIYKAFDKGFNVIITVDTGITAVEEAKLANELGISLIITDHHEPPETLPNAFAIINPKKKNDKYPFKGLAGVGVAFKLSHALLGRVPEELMDIVTIGTIADLVPLIDENRTITIKGLRLLKETKHIGLKVLLEKTGLLEKEINAGHIGFIIGPRINASGRLGSAGNAVRLFITETREEAEELANLLDEINQERQALVENATNEALHLIISNNMQDDKVIIVANEGWNEGIIGIVASRVMEKYYRPTIILSIDKETNQAKGSARSIEGYDIYKALTTTKDLLPNFGGHTAAAGLSIHVDHIELLRKRLNELAASWLSDEDFTPIERVDASCNLEHLDVELIKQIENMAPFGIGNPSPKILIDEVSVMDITNIGKNKQHLKLNLENDKKMMEALFFSKGEMSKDISKYSTIQLLGELTVNEWNGTVKPQMIVKDLRIPNIQIFDWRKSNWQERLVELEKDNSLLVLDGQEPFDLKEWNTISYDRYTNQLAEHLVFVHLPASLQAIKNILTKHPKVERIYCIFDNNMDDLSAYLNRDYFKKVYVTIKQNKELQNKTKAEQYFKNLKINSEILHFILDVFSELGFIIIEGDQMIIHSSPMKKELTDSSLYRDYEEKNNLRKLLLHSNHQMLRKWFLDEYMG